MHWAWDQELRTRSQTTPQISDSALQLCQFARCTCDMAASVSSDQYSSEEEEEVVATDKMPEGHVKALEDLRYELDQGMSTARVLDQLQRVGLLDRRGSEQIMALPTPSERNEEIINEIRRGRGPDALPRFISALRPIHFTLSEKLASKVWPFRTQVLWFVESPTHAAVVVDLLGEARDYGFVAGFTFDGVQRTSSNRCYFQRGLLFDEDGSSKTEELEGLEVVVAFPSSVRDVPQAVESAFSEVCPKADVAVMSGVCRGRRWRGEGEGDGVRSGDTIVVTQAFDERQGSAIGAPVGPKDEFVQVLRQRLLEVVGGGDQPAWVGEVERMKEEEASLRYKTLWLTRLFVELQTLQGRGRGGGGGGEGEGVQTSPWLASPELGWDLDEPSLLSEHNLAVLSQCLPDWESGTLASTLLHSRRLWTVDHTSPLGMAPNPNLVAIVERAVECNPQFPSQPSPQASSLPLTLPVYGAMATIPQDTQRREEHHTRPHPPSSCALATDFSSYQFYEVCSSSRRLGLDKPLLVCKGVSYEVGGKERACVVASSCVILEVVRRFAVDISAGKEASQSD